MSEASTITPIRTSRQFNLISAGLAFVLWGGWAYFVNSRAPDGADRAPPVVSGLIQGVGSCCVTLMMVRSVAWLYHHLPAGRLRLVLPALLTVAVTGTAFATVHTLAGTANVVGTIAPALTVALGFNLFTTNKIHQVARRRSVVAAEKPDE